MVQRRPGTVRHQMPFLQALGRYVHAPNELFSHPKEIEVKSCTCHHLRMSVSLLTSTSTVLR